MESTGSTVRKVFTNKNILVISLTTTLWGVANSGWQTYWSLWLREDLGISLAMVGLLSTFQTAEQLLFQLPGGIITDKIGRRKIILVGTCLRFGPPILYLMATNWEHVLLATIINASTSIYNPALEAIVADSLPSRQRGTGYGAYRMITSLPRVFMPTMGGLIMDAYGYNVGVKFFNLLTILFVLIMLIVRLKLITETLATAHQKRSTKTTFSDALHVPGSIWAMMTVATVAGFSLRMIQQLTPIFAREMLNLSNTEIGLASTAMSLTSTLLTMPSGLLSDRIGRKPLILIAETITPATTLAIPFVNGFPMYLILQILTGIGSALGGRHMGFSGGPAWQALISDYIPPEKRGTVMGLQSTVSGVVGTPAPIVGTHVWDNYSPGSAFIASAAIAAGVIPIFLFFVKEEKKREE